MAAEQCGNNCEIIRFFNLVSFSFSFFLRLMNLTMVYIFQFVLSPVNFMCDVDIFTSNTLVIQYAQLDDHIFPKSIQIFGTQCITREFNSPEIHNITCVLFNIVLAFVYLINLPCLLTFSLSACNSNIIASFAFVKLLRDCLIALGCFT